MAKQHNGTSPLDKVSKDDDEILLPGLGGHWHYDTKKPGEEETTVPGGSISQGGLVTDSTSAGTVTVSPPFSSSEATSTNEVTSAPSSSSTDSVTESILVPSDTTTPETSTGNMLLVELTAQSLVPDVFTELVGLVNETDLVNQNETAEVFPRELNETAGEHLVLAPGYTVFGEACADECDYRGYSYTWCNKKRPSVVGTWSEYGYCTLRSNHTPYDEDCIDECAQRGYDYYWCHKSSSRWGYCTPEHLIMRTTTWQFLVKGQEEDEGEGGLAPGAEKGGVKAYTTFGAPCSDSCKLRDDKDYTWCTKQNPDDPGTFPTYDHCTNSAGEL